MIDSIKGYGYEQYGINNQQIKIDSSNKKTEIENLDIQEILRQVENYTYTEQDKSKVEPELLGTLTEKLNITEEDVYELYSRGVDLEALSINELDYRNKSGYKPFQEEEEELSEEAQDKIRKKEDRLEDKIEVIKKQNDSMYLYALTDKSPITINSLYENSFKGEFKKGISQYTKEDVDNVLVMNGLDKNSGNTWAANLLMMYDIGVSSQNVNKLQNMQAAISALELKENGSLSGEEELIKEGQVQYKPEYVERITDELGMVTDEHIEKLIEEGKDININELRESIHKNVNEALSEGRKNNRSSLDRLNSQEGQVIEGEAILIEDQVEEVKKQIEQIRTKLTVEAAQKISARMPLESSQLASVADALLQIEGEQVVEALQEADLPVTEENITGVTQVMNATDSMKSYFMETVQIELRTDEAATLNEIHSALRAYSDNETPVELRFGENIARVEGQIRDLLESQGIEATKTNVEAAKALITNQMEVNELNIRSIQEIVVKLNTFLEEMTPIQAAQLIKEGINPYEASVNELLNVLSSKKIEGLKNSVAETIVDMEKNGQISADQKEGMIGLYRILQAVSKQKEEVMGYGLKNSVAETIVDMEKNGQISADQKEGMIGLYRILQAVSKQKEEVMGYLFRNELPLTVENLQQATKYVTGKRHVDSVIDDNFGETESLVYDKETAKQLLEQSTNKTSKTLEIIKELENMALPITEDTVSKVTKMSALLYPYIKEQYKKHLGKFEGMGTLPESFLEKLESVKGVDQELVKHMIEQKVPLTLSNIYWMNKMANEPDIYGKLLDAKEMLKEGLPADLEELEEELSQFENRAKEYKEEAVLKGDLLEYKSYKQIEEVVHYQRARIENEGLYQIPFMIDGERRLINLYLHKDESNKVKDEGSHLKAVITYETKHLGTVKAYLEIKDENIGYRVEAENAEDMQKLQVQSEQLISRLKAIGYHVQYNEFMNQEKEHTEVSENKYRESNFEEVI